MTVFICREQIAAIAGVFDNEMHMTIGKRRMHRVGDFLQNVWRSGIGDLIDGVEPKTIEPKRLQPMKNVSDEIRPYRRFLKGNPGSPRCGILAMEEAGRIVRKEVSFRSKMIVDHIEEDH